MTGEAHDPPTRGTPEGSPTGPETDHFESPSEDGISLDELSESFARLISAGDDPYAAAAEVSEHEPPADEHDDVASELPSAMADDDDQCPVTPRSILEAMLFVGHPANEPLTSKRVAELMRGVRPEEIDGLIGELNEDYSRHGCPYFIESLGEGYRMTLRPEYDSLRENFHRRTREATLSQPAIDVLAIVAYQQPIQRREIEKIREKPCASLLNQLVRRQLLRVERDTEKGRSVTYRTTDRFLDLFELDSLDDLPHGAESELAE